LLERGQFGPKLPVQGVVPTNHSSCWRKNVDTSFFRFVAIHAFYSPKTDRRTDRQTAFLWLYRALHYMPPHGKNVTNRPNLQ